MPSYIEMLGQQAGGQAAGNFVNEGMGLIFQGIKNKQQLQQQRRLSELDIMNQTEMMKRSEEQQMRMWKNTSYPAQIEMMKKAGLNPGLMYGMGGGGGATTGGTPAHAGGQAASVAQPSRGSEGMGMMIGQMGLLEAQRKNIEADTKLKEVDAAKKAGVDTENVQAQTGLTRLQTEIAQVAASVSRQTINEQMKAWENIVEKGTAEIDNLKVDTQKKTQEIENLKSEVALNSIKGALMQAQKNNVNQDTKNKIQEILESEARIKTMAQQLMIMWDKLNLETQGARIEWDKHLSTEDWEKIKDLVPTFLLPIGKGFGTGANPIKGFHNR